MKQNSFIPDHSLEALEEAYQAALFNLAFQQIEQEELAEMCKRIHKPSQVPPKSQFEKKLENKLRRERTKSFLLYKLPRVAQVAACLIAVLSIGAGVALAASREVRSWAAGVLTGTVIDESGFWFGNGPLALSITDGVNLDEQLLLVEDGETLTLHESMEAEPVHYEWKDRGERKLSKLVAYDDTIYALFEDGYKHEAEPEEEGVFKRVWLGESFDRVGLGWIQLGKDGAFSVEELAYFDGKELFGTGVKGCVVSSAAAGNGKLYFVAVYDEPAEEGFSFSDRRARLLAYDLTSFELTELPLPIENKNSPECKLFSDGEVFLATSTQELPVQIWRIDADGSCTGVAEFGEGSRPNSFAYRAATDTLYYQRDSAIYAAAHFDVANAQRMALSNGYGGKGLMLGKNSYAVITNKVEIFNFDEKIGNVSELVVGGGFGSFMIDKLREQNSELTLTNDPIEYDVQKSGTSDIGKLYREKLLSGEAKADLISSFYDDDSILHAAGWGKSIKDDVICAEIDCMPESVRKYVTRDGEYIAYPYSVFCAYPDLCIDSERWAELGLGEEPQTWLELMQKLSELSHSDHAGKYVISTNGMTLAQTLALNMTDGFARSWAARGMEMDFGGTDFQAAMEALKGINFSALRCFEEGNDVNDQFIVLPSGIYDPVAMPTSVRGITLKIRPEDKKISGGGCHIARINPASDEEELAYSYLHVQVGLDEPSIFERLRYDFATPAEELAKLSGELATAEEIETYRAAVGDVWIGGLSLTSAESRNDTLSAYANGKISFSELAEKLNAIYAG